MTSPIPRDSGGSGPRQVLFTNLHCQHCSQITNVNLNSSFRFTTPCYISRRGAERQSSQSLSHCFSMYLFAPIG